MEKVSCFIVIFFALLIGIQSKALGQAFKKDTLYYLVDTVGTPVNDRIIEISRDNSRVIYTINCPCLDGGKYPKLLTNVKNDVIVNSVAGISFSKLKDMLVNFKLNSHDFQSKYVLYLFTEHNNGYVKQRGFLITDRETTIDNITVKQ